MTDLETVRAQHRVTAACRGRDAPTDTSDPFLQTSIRDAVTRRILGVIRAGAASMPRRSPGREAVLWDGDVPGLGLRARASGRRTWIVRRRVGNAFVKRTPSSADAMSVENAMAATMRRWRCRRCGSLGRRSSRTAPGVRSRQPRQRMRTTCSGPSPAFGNRRVGAVTARNVRNWFDDLSVTRAATCEPVVDGAVVPEEARQIFGAAAEGVEPLSRWWSTASRFAA